MEAGAAVRTLMFPECFFPVEGFTKEIDSLHARVLVLDGGMRCAVLVLEMTSLPSDEIEALKAILKEQTQAEQCFCLVTHTFSAPHFMPDHILKTEEEHGKKAQLRSVVYDAVREAAAEAAQNIQPVSVAVGSTQCMVNTARDVETPLGWWIGNNGPGPVDHTMTAIRFGDAAVLIHYPIQSSVLDGSKMKDGGKVVSGDLAGMMVSTLEETLGCPVLFLIGAAGDQAPRQKAVLAAVDVDGSLEQTDLQEAAIPICREQAAEMTAAVLTALKAAEPMHGDTIAWHQTSVTVPAKKIERDLHKLRPTRIPPYVPDGESVQSVDLLQIGDLQLIGVKPELNCVTAAQISGGDPMVKVVTLWNGGAKYMADAASCERITYESQNSPFMPGAAERLVSAAESLRLLHKVQ